MKAELAKGENLANLQTINYPPTRGFRYLLKHFHTYSNIFFASRYPNSFGRMRGDVTKTTWTTPAHTHSTWLVEIGVCPDFKSHVAIHIP